MTPGDRGMVVIVVIVETATKEVEVEREGGDPVPAHTKAGTKEDLLHTIIESQTLNLNLTRDQINNQFKNSINLFLLL